jgi:hypothetical protein
MSQILWRKQYILNHNKGHFRIYISEHTNGLIYGSVVYYTRQGDWSKGEEIDPELKVESFYGKSEEEAFNICVKWIDDNLGKEYKITQ